MPAKTANSSKVAKRQQNLAGTVFVQPKFEFGQRFLDSIRA